MTSNKNLWFINQEGKIEIDDSGKYLCPPHCLPHKFPIDEPVKDEPCHAHMEPNKSLRTWRRFHHNTFCFLYCPHYGRMIKKTKELDTTNEKTI